jgi:hypothetical protein
VLTGPSVGAKLRASLDGRSRWSWV